MEDFFIPTDKIKRIQTSYNKETCLKDYNAGVLDFSKVDRENNNVFVDRYLSPDTLLINFNNLSEVFSLTKKLGKPKSKYKASQEIRSGSWVTFNDYETAENVFLTKPNSVVDFNSNDIAINDYSESGNLVEYDVVGDFIDIGRYLDNVPENFGQMRLGNYRGVRVKIILSGGQSCGVDSSLINHQSKRVARLVDWLENQGIRVSLNVVYSNSNGHFDIKVKDYSEPLSITDVCIASHSDFFRRMIFRLKEVSKTLQSSYGSSYSFSDTLFYTLKDERKVLSNLNNMVIALGSGLSEISKIDNEFNNLEKVIKHLLDKDDYKRYLTPSIVNQIIVEGGIMS